MPGMPSKRFAIDFKLPCRVSAPVTLPRPLQSMPTAMRSRSASSLPAMSRYRDAQLPSPSPPDAVQDRCLGPVAFVRWLPSSVAFAIARPTVQDRSRQDRSPRPLPSPCASDAFVRSRPASSLHAMSRLQRCAVAFAIATDAVVLAPGHGHVTHAMPSPARSRPWPCHATAMRSCLRHRHRCPMQSKTVAL